MVPPRMKLVISKHKKDLLKNVKSRLMSESEGRFSSDIPVDIFIGCVTIQPHRKEREKVLQHLAAQFPQSGSICSSCIITQFVRVGLVNSARSKDTVAQTHRISSAYFLWLHNCTTRKDDRLNIEPTTTGPVSGAPILRLFSFPVVYLHKRCENNVGEMSPGLCVLPILEIDSIMGPSRPQLCGDIIEYASRLQSITCEYIVL